MFVVFRSPEHVASASPHEVTLVEATLKRSFIDETPESLIGDKTYDSDKRDAIWRLAGALK